MRSATCWDCGPTAANSLSPQRRGSRRLFTSPQREEVERSEGEGVRMPEFFSTFESLHHSLFPTGREGEGRGDCSPLPRGERSSEARVRGFGCLEFLSYVRTPSPHPLPYGERECDEEFGR